jgi:hypothetical protein
MTTARFPEGSLSEITCQSSVGGDRFSSGNQNFVWSVGQPNCFVPSESFFVIDCTVTANGVQPLMSDNLALSNDVGSCLYNNAYAKVGGQDISSITRFLPQASIVNKRLKKTRTWTESVGKSIHGLEPSFLERQKAIAYDGKPVFDKNSQVNLGPLLGTVAVTALTGVVAGANGIDFQSKEFDYLDIAGIKLKVLGVTGAGAATVEVTAELTAFGNIAPTTEFQAYAAQRDRAIGNNRQQIVWQPPIGFFDYAQPMGSGDYQLQLNPSTEYKKSAVNSVENLAIGNGAGQFDFVVNDVKLYIATYKHTVPDTPVIMGLRESLVQSKTLSGGTEQFQFTVPPSCVGLSYFIQASDAGMNTEHPPTYLGNSANDQNLISSYQITFANKTVPQTRWSGVLDVIGATPNQISRNTLQQRYHDTFTEAQLIEYGPESLSEWVEGGPIVYHNFVRSSEYRATQVQFSITGPTAYGVPTKLYVVAHYKTSTEIQTSMGMITSVRSLSVM